MRVAEIVLSINVAICGKCKLERARGSWRNSHLCLSPHGLMVRKTFIHLQVNN